MHSQSTWVLHRHPASSESVAIPFDELKHLVLVIQLSRPPLISASSIPARCASRTTVSSAAIYDRGGTRNQRFKHTDSTPTSTWLWQQKVREFAYVDDISYPWISHLAHEERVPRLEGDEFVEVEQDIEQGARQPAIAFQVPQCKAALGARLDHVMHLAEHVLEQHRLLTQALHPMQLLLVEVLHGKQAP